MDALSVFLHGSSPVIAAVKEHEMEIGCPTDVKHVAHIGWDSAAGGASPSWVNGHQKFRALPLRLPSNVWILIGTVFDLVLGLVYLCR